MTNTPESVFISYARSSGAEAAQALAAALGDRAFLDTKSIPYGARFPREIAEAVLNARVVVIFADQAYFESVYCLAEMQLAISTGAFEQIWVALNNGDHAASLPWDLQHGNWPKHSETAAIVKDVESLLARGLKPIRERDPEKAKRAFDDATSKFLVPPPGQFGSVPHVGLTSVNASIGDRFVGREREICELHRVLTSRPAAKAALQGVLHGQAGFGKTRLAIEYAQRFGPLAYPGGVFWLNAEAGDLELQYRAMLLALDPGADVSGDVAAKLARAFDRVPAKEQRILFIADNVPEEGGAIDQWCPASAHVTLLATSRGKIAGMDEEIPVSELPPDAARRLLTRRLPNASDPRWDDICQWVGYHSLALEILNGALDAGATTLDELVEAAKRASPIAELEDQYKVVKGSVKAVRGVTESLDISYRKLPPAAQRAARLIARLAPEPVPLILLKALVPASDLAAVRAALRTRNWISGEAAGPMYGRMHRVLGGYLCSLNEPVEEWMAVCRALVDVLKPSACGDPKRWSDLNPCAPHADHVFDCFSKHDIAGAEIADWEPVVELGVNAGILRGAQGLSAAARRTEERAVDLARSKLGVENTWALTAMNNLAGTLREQGDLAGARKLHEEELAVCRRVQGAEHPETLKSMNNLAGTLREQGDLAGARKLHEETLAVRRRVLGAQHANTLTSANNLATTLRAQGDLAGARKLHEETLAVRRRVLGAEHPDTLQSMNNLSVTLNAQGDLTGERKLHEETLEVRRRVLGERHPYTSNSAWNLFRTLEDLHEQQAAQAVLDRDLLWLLKRSPEELHTLQRNIHGCLRNLPARGFRIE